MTPDPEHPATLPKLAALEALKQPLPAWPPKAVWGCACGFVVILGSLPTEPRWLGSLIASVCFLTTISCFVTVIARLNKRIEALTTLLLEQQAN